MERDPFFDDFELVPEKNQISSIKFGPRLSLVLPSWTSFEN